jgi:hypothetical protein
MRQQVLGRVEFFDRVHVVTHECIVQSGESLVQEDHAHVARVDEEKPKRLHEFDLEITYVSSCSEASSSHGAERTVPSKNTKQK